MSARETYSSAKAAASPFGDNPFGRLEGAVSELARAEAMLDDLVSQLAGETPSSDDAKGLSPVRSGLIGRIDDHAERISALAQRIINGVHRVTARL